MSGGNTQFLRPADLGRTPRNHRRVQARRALILAANILLAAGVGLWVLWMYQKVQQDRRFRLVHVEITGAKHTRRAEVLAALDFMLGQNLFRVDIAAGTVALGRLPWVRHAAIEKRLPDTLVVHIAERKPVALARIGDRVHYVDAGGAVFAPLSPRSGDPDLPLIHGRGAEIRQCVAFLQELSRSDPALYARVGDIAAAGSGFRIFDRALGMPLYLGDAAATKWRLLYQIIAAEKYEQQSIQYADLRFSDRVVIRSTAQPRIVSASPPVVVSEIAN